MNPQALYWLNGAWQSLDVENANNLDNLDSTDFSLTNHKHFKSDIADFPASLPANGGNADTVNGKTVEVNVPADAKFTDTIYAHPATHPASMISGTLAIGNIPTGTSASTVALGNHTHGEFTTITNTLATKSNATNLSNGTGSSSLKVTGCTSSGSCSFAIGSSTTASGNNSYAEGTGCKALKSACHAEGFFTVANNDYCHAEGCSTEASGSASHAEGYHTVASGHYSHAEGYYTKSSAWGSHAKGGYTTASGQYSCAEGYYANATAEHGNARGYYATAETYGANVIGQYNKVNSGSKVMYSSTQNAFVIGNGTSASALANAFRVTYNGKAYALSAFNSTGADYAEYFEWKDGNPKNEDRIGRFVALDGNKIKLATSQDDYIIGIISGNQSIIGNSCEDGWNEMYVRDEFDRLQYEDVEVEKEEYIINEETNEAKAVTKKVIEKHIKLNPNYNSSLTYMPRSERPEWGIVGMLGQIKVIDDGTCKVNGYCKPSKDGIATYSDDKSHYRVIERINDHLIKVIFR